MYIASGALQNLVILLMKIVFCRPAPLLPLYVFLAKPSEEQRTQRREMAHGDSAKGRARAQVNVEEDGVVRHGQVHDDRAHPQNRQVEPPGRVAGHVGHRRVLGPGAHPALNELHHRYG